MKLVPFLLCACLMFSHARAADVLQPEHQATHEVVIERTANAYRVGDFVDVLDADGRTFTVQIKRITGEDVEFETAAGDAVKLPVERIIEKVGMFSRAWAWLTDTTAGNWTLAGGGGLLALGAGKVVTDAQVSTDKDTDQVPRAEAVAMANAAAQAAEASTVLYGPSVAVKYTPGGTWTAAAQASGTGAWVPSITFGLSDFRPDGASGRVDSVRGPPAAIGEAPQTFLGGTWKQTGERDLLISGTTDTYSGPAQVGGDSGNYTLSIKGLLYTGGTMNAVAVEPQP
jgi:hypothetical protein